MTGYYEIAPARTVGPAFQLARFVVVLFVVAGIAHRYAFLGTSDFVLVGAVVFALAVVGALFWAHAFRQVWRKGRPGGRRLAVAGFLLALGFLPFVLSGVALVRYPRLSDISTDRADPPAFFAIGQIARAPDARRPGANSPDPARQDAAYPEITGRRYTSSPDIVMEEVDRLVEEKDWSQVHHTGTPQADTEISVEGVVHTLVLRFPVDVVVRMTDEGDATYVDMRSASQFGQHDLGDNARRIDDFLSDLDAAMLARGGV
jgi:uncharacterized protein (DUF1499 family)